MTCGYDNAPAQGSTGAMGTEQGSPAVGESTTCPDAPMLDVARMLTSRGFSVLPLRGKIPLTPHGVKDATIDPRQVLDWWTRWPAANVGARVNRGHVVLDIDPRNGGAETWDRLTAGRGLPPTWVTLTGSGGWHWWSRMPVAGRLRGNLDRTAGPGIDVKSHSGYVVMPPSVHPGTGRRYLFQRRTPAMAELPGWLVPHVYRPQAPRRTPIPSPGPGNGAGLVRAVSEAVEGTRNGVLFWAACRAYADGLSLDEDLTAAALTVGLDETEINRTLRSARHTAGGDGRRTA